mmetsp:Transcript_78251/g.135756  ORF Transcript_78251/g.135756 Transcript_78251/m.135756 type:complete len:144 (+) Transcript_78251:166-597(+)
MYVKPTTRDACPAGLHPPASPFNSRSFDGNLELAWPSWSRWSAAVPPLGPTTASGRAKCARPLLLPTYGDCRQELLSLKHSQMGGHRIPRGGGGSPRLGLESSSGWACTCLSASAFAAFRLALIPRLCVPDGRRGFSGLQVGN